jgi:hypothetical protein
MAAGPLAAAAPLIVAMESIRFDATRHPTDVTGLGAAVQEAIRSWS